MHIARSSRYPVCVHCSAGIGRTGTLVALELLQRNFMHSIEPSVPQIVSEIRSQRAQAVQTEDQLVWIYFVMLGKLCYHGLMAQQDYKVFHAEYEDYIKAMGGQQPIAPSFPKESAPIKAPSGENVTQPPAMSKGKARRRPKTQRMRNQSVNKDEENGVILLGPAAAATQTPQPPAASSSSSGIDLQQQLQPRRRSAPSSGISNPTINREPKSQRRRRKPKEINKRAEGLVPAQIGGRMAVAEELPQQQQQQQYRNYHSLQQQLQQQQQQRPSEKRLQQAPIIAAIAKQDEEYETARSDRPPPLPPLKTSSEMPQAPSCEDNNYNSASAENLRRKSDEDAQPKSVFLQPHLASEQKKQFFAASKPMPNGPSPAPTKDDNSYYLDAPLTPGKSGTPVKFDDADGYFAAPKNKFVFKFVYFF
uniref:Uncharacterized protein n=1 Tax=Panagrolaimus superbus TaxID=310955 RepID=A0A914XXB2_9BILA